MKYLILILIFFISSCNYEEGSEDTGLFSGHKSVTDTFEVLTSTANTYIEDDYLLVSIKHPFPITVTGIPKIPIIIGSSTKNISYYSGNGTNIITFRYTILSGDSDTDGIEVGTSIDLNGGSLKFNNGSAVVDATTTIPNTSMNNVKVDAVAPTVTQVAVTNLAGVTILKDEYIQLAVTFSESVNITGVPQLELDIGGTTRLANYLSGSGSSVIYFRYQVKNTDSDTGGNGFNYTDLVLNSGTIKDLYSNDADLSGVTDTASSIDVDGDSPYVQNITAPMAKSYKPGEFVEIILNFSEVVTITNTPRIPLTVGASTKYAFYQSGSGTSDIVFRYAVTSGDVDEDGIEIQNLIDLNTGTIKDGGGKNAILLLKSPQTPNVLVDGLLPAVTSVTLPLDGTYKLGDEIYFTLNFNTVVNVTGFPQLNMQLDSTAPTPTWVVYNSGSGTSGLVMRYVVGSNDTDLDGFSLENLLDLNSGTIQNSDLTNANLDMTNAIAAIDTSNIIIDGIKPFVTSITPPADDSYPIGATIDFILHFNETVNITFVPQRPRLELDIGGTTVYANYFSGTGTTDITFRYTVQTGKLDADGIELVSTEIDLRTSGKILDIATNEAVLDLSPQLPLSLTNVLIDGIIPNITSVTAPAATSYGDTNNLDFIINTDDNIYVTGTPRIPITIGSTSYYLDYFSGDSTSTLTFRYTIINGDNDNDGVATSSPIDLNSGSLSDLAGNNLVLTFTPPDSSGVIVDGIVPVVTISYSPDITTANQNLYSVSGTCSENGDPVTVNIDGLSFTPTCSAGTYSIGSQDVSSRVDNPALSITASQTDSVGNIGNASTTVDKTTTVPTVTITTTADITQANLTSYIISGACSDSGEVVSIMIGAISKTANCSGGNWSTAPIDATSLAEGVVNITADHLTATQATTSVNKDTTSSTVTISSAPDINSSNEFTYVASGTCSDNGTNVDVNIGALNYNLSCSNKTWTTGMVDVSSLIDAIGISVTADHATATQATKTINKASGTPSISSLSAPTTLAESIDLVWSLDTPGGFTIDDYTINYRVKGSPTWLEFVDGVSTTTSTTVTLLNPSSIYEFRVKVLFDSGSESDWSNTAEGETKPDDPIFGPYTAMNVGGSTDTTVVAYQDSTAITLNGVVLTTLNKGQTHTFASVKFDLIDADKPIYTAGRRGNTSPSTSANIAWNPTAWSGKSFSFNSTRTNPQNLEVYAVEDTYIEVKQGSTVLDSATITKGNGTTLSWSVYGSYQVVATGSVLAFHVAAGGGNLNDPKPLIPGFTEIIGFPSSSMELTTTSDGTNYNLLHSDSTTGSGSLNKTDSITIAPQGTSSEYQSESLLITADKLISGASFADANGNCAGAFMSTNLMKTKYAIPTNSDYIAFASKTSGTIEVRDSSDTLITTLTLSRTGGNSNAPYKVRMINPLAGYRFIASAPVAAWYQPNNYTGASDQDETLMYGTND